MAITLVCIEIPNNRHSHNVVGQLYFKNKPTHRKRDQISGYQRQGRLGVELDEGSQKVQTSSYK